MCDHDAERGALQIVLYFQIVTGDPSGTAKRDRAQLAVSPRLEMIASVDRFVVIAREFERR